MIYTINGKEYTEFDINKRCAELMIDYEDIDYNPFPDDDTSVNYGDGTRWHKYNPCTNPLDTWPIIEKCWDKLMDKHYEYSTPCKWENLIQQHNCTKLVAACICFIEMAGE